MRVEAALSTAWHGDFNRARASSLFSCFQGLVLQRPFTHITRPVETMVHRSHESFY